MRADPESAAEWDELLESEGLGEIERVNAQGNLELKEYAANAYRGANELEREARLNHFLECSRLCHFARFKSEVEEHIMEFYCEGISILDIQRKLEQNGVIRHRETISNVIRKYLILFGLYDHGK